MMYIQITTRCNMSCEHCCYACTAEGEDMSPEVYQAALARAEEYGAVIAIGGGEPTLHPEFWNFLIDAITADVEDVWMATNGSITKTALKLAKLARKGVLGVALSQDYYHDPIDWEVIQAFKRDDDSAIFASDRDYNDLREIRDVTEQNPYRARQPGEGLAPFRNPEDGGARENCPCSEIIVKPNGDVHLCGCVDSPKIGDVFNGWEVPENVDGCIYDCYQDYDPKIFLERNWQSFYDSVEYEEEDEQEEVA